MTDPLLCPRCSTPSHPVAMRTRGEVRSRVWQCGCVIAPEVRVESFGVLSERLHVARGHAIEELHPTEAGAVAAWRVALEQRQREYDEAWANPTPVRASWRLAIMGGKTAPADYDRPAPVPAEWTDVKASGYHRDEFEAALNAEIERATAGVDLACTASVTARVMPIPVEMYASREWQDQVMQGLMQHRERQAAADLDATGPIGRISQTATTRGLALWLPEATDDEVWQVAAACTEATHVETLVAVANECARRWPERVPAAVARPHWTGSRWRFEADRGDVMLRDSGPGCVAMWTQAGEPYTSGPYPIPALSAVVRALGAA